jgi:DNA-binding transcriptional LysR family regulator
MDSDAPGTLTEPGGLQPPRSARPRFDWNLLHTFMVIVEEGSVTRAANRLLLRQPSVSNALKRLEDRLGHRLIDRSQGRFELTDQGRVLYRECRDICGAIGRLDLLLDDGAADLAGHVRLVMASHVVFPPLDEVLRAFHARHPLVTIEINVMRSSAVHQTVLSRQATAGICLVGTPHPHLAQRPLFREHFGFFCGPAHRLFGRSDLTLADLRDEQVVSFGTDSATDVLRPLTLFRAAHGMRGRIVGTSWHLEEVVRLIGAGLGIGPLPIHAVHAAVTAGRLWRLPPYDDAAGPDAPPAVEVHLVTNPRISLSQAERRLLDMLAETVRAAPGGLFVYPEPISERP